MKRIISIIMVTLLTVMSALANILKVTILLISEHG